MMISLVRHEDPWPLGRSRRPDRGSCQKGLAWRVSLLLQAFRLARVLPRSVDLGRKLVEEFAHEARASLSLGFSGFRAECVDHCE